MFPTSSYNTPHGYQFGREAAIFTEESALNPELWDDALRDQALEFTDRPQDHGYESERARALAEAASRTEANVIALPTERRESREQAAQDVRDFAHVSKLIRSMRDRSAA